MSLPAIGICGLGQMGSSAAVLFSRCGYPVILWGRNAEKLRACREQLDEMSRFLDEQFGSSPQTPGEIETTTDLAAINERAAYTLECIAENLDQKVEFLRKLVPAIERGGVLMTCTSGLSVSTMGERSGTGRRLVGAHFWNPPHLMPLVEVISGKETEAGLGDEVAALMRRVGKIAVVCKDVPGFIGNRLLHALFREAVHLVESGVCSPEDVDTVARLTFALRMPAVGPCENMDLVGMPLVADIQSYLLADLSTAQGAMPAIKDRIASGLLGMRSGKGFYDWEERDAKGLIEARDRQIVRQLKTLKELGRLS
jgi:3-hydroxybutyryl-CoA dehydrogenase